MTLYATTEELATWMTIDDTLDNETLEGVLEATSRWIDEYTGRTFALDTTATARLFRAGSACEVAVSDIGDTTGLVVKTDRDGDGTFETTITGYELGPLNAPAYGKPYTTLHATGSTVWPTNTGRAAVEVTALWGWPAVPGPVKTACLLQASRLAKRRYSPEGVAGFGEFGAVRILADHDVTDLLDGYRLVTGFA